MMNRSRKILDKEATILLQQYLYPEGMPRWARAYKNSPELMTIFFYLFMSDLEQLFESAALTQNIYQNIDQKIAAIMCTSDREVIRFKVVTPFVMSTGKLKKHIDLPRHVTERKLRECKIGDTLLLRRDYKLGTSEVQVLRDGLFGEDADLAWFTIDTEGFERYYSYLQKEYKVTEGYRVQD